LLGRLFGSWYWHLLYHFSSYAWSFQPERFVGSLTRPSFVQELKETLNWQAFDGWSFRPERRHVGSLTRPSFVQELKEETLNWQVFDGWSFQPERRLVESLTWACVPYLEGKSGYFRPNWSKQKK
jgi:hypothetical protein